MSARARIAVFLPDLRGGGAERVAVHLSNALADRGYAVELVLAQAEGPYLGDVSPSVGVADLKAKRLLTAVPPLARYLRQRKPDVLMSHLDYANVGAVAARSLGSSKARLILVEHITLSMAGRHCRSAKAPLITAAVKRLYRKADRIVAVSRGCAEDLIRLTGVTESRVKVIYNPVISPAMAELARQEPGHPWLKPGEPPVVLGIGRLTQQKDFPTLIRAFERLSKMSEARLLILGEGEDRPQLEALVRELGLSDRAALPGFVKNPYALLSRCALFALSSAWEALPTVLIEALALGARAVSTDCPAGPREILQDGKLGRLVPPGDPQALAQAMEEALRSHAPNVPESALAPYRREFAAGEYAKLIEELLASER